jgi:predicted dehydrogenase
MTNLTPEQRALGRENAYSAIGSTRRDFLKAAAAAPALGAFYFAYNGIAKPVKAAIIGTGNEGCGAMIKFHNRAYVDFIGYCDCRPSQQKRAVKEFSEHKDYTPDEAKKLQRYDTIDDICNDKNVEMVVIALPLWLHAPAAIKALKAGKHVFCEKLMAHNISQCKEMIHVAREEKKLLAIGHQRHYSALYDNANYLVQSGQLGEIRHIRALWHRNIARPVVLKVDKGEPVYARDKQGNIIYNDSWKPAIPAEDESVDFKKYGYKSVEELVRWRLYDRTGAGLMAELGSHQLDACSIFLGKKHPLAVTGIGGTFFYTDNREVEDHVFCTFEFPGKAEKDHVVVTYSSITTNAFERYGEEVMGTNATMFVEEEKDVLLFKEGGGPAAARTTSITVETKAGGKPVIEASPSASGPSTASSLGGVALADPSRGYREELEHFAYCVRNGDKSNPYDDKEHMPRCHGEVAMADAIVALTSNLAMRQKRRIDFDPDWFDYKSSSVPDGSANRVAKRG